MTLFRFGESAFHTLLFYTAAFSVAAVSSVVAETRRETAAELPAPLNVGDPAPEMGRGTWLKGEPIQAFEKGRVYVVEFWATWCGPCRFAMPHLSKLARKHAGEVTIIGVNVWENSHSRDKGKPHLEKVASFVRRAGDVMAYSVVADEAGGKDGYFSQNWLTPANVSGIPTSFVITREGKIGWIGNPIMGLDEAIEFALADKLDEAARSTIKADVDAAFKKAGELNQEMRAALEKNDAAVMLEVAARAMAASPLVREMSRIVTYTGLSILDPARARAYGEDFARELANDPIKLRIFAREILNSTRPNPDYDLAVHVMETAMNSSEPEDPILAPLLAQAYHKAGQNAKAVTLQQKFVDSLAGPENAFRLPAAKSDLEKYRSADPKP